MRGTIFPLAFHSAWMVVVGGVQLSRLLHPSYLSLETQKSSRHLARSPSPPRITSAPRDLRGGGPACATAEAEALLPGGAPEEGETEMIGKGRSHEAGACALFPGGAQWAGVRSLRSASHQNRTSSLGQDTSPALLWQTSRAFLCFLALCADGTLCGPVMGKATRLYWLRRINC